MIEFRDVTLRVGAFQMTSISFVVPAGKYGVLMGRTGSGKTTLLEALCGLIPIQSGAILANGNDLTRMPPARRQIGFVPQDAALFTSMTVRDNIGFPLSVRKVPSERRNVRVEEVASWLGISHLLGRRPLGLSGGEKQRVALGRALAHRPSILCLDEPLSALDEETRESMCQLLSDIQRRTQTTMLHVTHHSGEAARLGDQLLRIDQGHVAVGELP